MDSQAPGITQFEQRAGHNLKNSRLTQPRAGNNPAGKRTAEGLGQKAREIKILTTKAGKILLDTTATSTTHPCHGGEKEGFVSMSLQFLHNKSSSWGYSEPTSTALTARSILAS